MADSDMPGAAQAGAAQAGAAAQPSAKRTRGQQNMILTQVQEQAQEKMDEMRTQHAIELSQRQAALDKAQRVADTLRNKHARKV